MRKIALALLLPVLATGCAGLKDFARSAFQEPTLTFRSASLQSLDLEGATVSFLFDLQNPNSVGVDVARANWAIELDQTRIAAGDLPTGLKVPANGTAPVAFPVRLRFRDVPGIIALITNGRDELPYRLSGSIGVRTPIGIVDLALSHADNLRLPKLPDFTVEGLSVKSVSLTTVSLALQLRVKNSNGFPLPVSALDYSLSIGGSRVAQAEGARIAGVPSASSTVVEIPVRVNLISLGLAASNLVQGGDVDVQLSGKANVAGLPLPLDLRARVPARR